MNPNQPSREQIELRITALLLGELPEAEAELLRYTISQDAALKKLHDELAATIALVREAEKNPAPADKSAPLKISDDRRAKLLAHFKTSRPQTKPAKELFWLKPIPIPTLKVPRLIEVLVVVAIVAVLAAMLMPSLASAKRKSIKVSAAMVAKQKAIEEQMEKEGALQAPVASEMPAPVAPADTSPGSAPASEPVALPDRSGSLAAASGADGRDIYVIKPGDTLSKIARERGTTVEALEEANNLSSTKILAGANLRVPVESAASLPPAVVALTPEPPIAPPVSGEIVLPKTESEPEVAQQTSGLNESGNTFSQGNQSIGYGLSSKPAAQRLPGLSAAAFENAVDEHALIEAERKKELDHADNGLPKQNTVGVVNSIGNSGGGGGGGGGGNATLGTDYSDINAPQNLGEEFRKKSVYVAENKQVGFDWYLGQIKPQETPVRANDSHQLAINGLREPQQKGTGVQNNVSDFEFQQAAPATTSGEVAAGKFYRNLGVGTDGGREKVPALGDTPALGGSLLKSSSAAVPGALPAPAKSAAAGFDMYLADNAGSAAEANRLPGTSSAGLPTVSGTSTLNFNNGTVVNGGMLPLNGENSFTGGNTVITVSGRALAVGDDGVADQSGFNLDAVKKEPAAKDREVALGLKTQTGDALTSNYGWQGQLAADQPQPGSDNKFTGRYAYTVTPATNAAVKTEGAKDSFATGATKDDVGGVRFLLAETNAVVAQAGIVVNAFAGSGGLRASSDVQGGMGGIRYVTTVNPSSDISVAARNYITTNLGVDLNNPPGKSVFYNERAGKLFVKATEQDLEVIEKALGKDLVQTTDPKYNNATNSTEFRARVFAVTNLPGLLADLSASSDRPVQKISPNAPVPQPEILTRENNFSTFSLNVSDVSFKLAAASLERGKLPDSASIRSEEFINAFDYRDPEAAAGQPLAFVSERARYPFAQNRDLLRFSVKTAASGRAADRPLNLVLLLDTSGSMERADRVAIIREALRVLASQLHPQDTVSVVTFARTPRLWADGVSGDKAGEALEKVGGITPEGGTNLEEAMRLAYETARRHYLANGINRVVLLTDGAANLGNVDPAALKQKVEAQRRQGIALDCFGIGWEDFDDNMLEELSGNGDGRYAFINSPEDAEKDFASKLAGALQVTAQDVKVQVEFNPQRVASWRQIGYAKHQLTKQQFRDNSVIAAEIAAQEAGNALYTVETKPDGIGPVATVYVRYRVPGTQDVRERSWTVDYTSEAPALADASPAMRLAATASAFSEWLAGSPFAQEVTLDELSKLLTGVPEVYGADERPKRLETMIREAKSVVGK